MPDVSRALIRAGVLHLAVAALLGMVLALPGDVPSAPVRAGLRPAQIHLLTVGWLTQIVFGVAMWMFPRPRGERRVRTGRLDWVAWAALNVGVALRLIGEPATLAGLSAARPGALLMASAFLQWLAVVHFALRLWPRVASR